MALAAECESLHLTTFKSLGLAEPILRALSGEGYTNPTPIQAGVIPAMLEGKDLVGIAQTGTGKTAAFVLPLLQRIQALNKRPWPKNCRALVLAPTRELAAQIEDGIRTYGQYLKTTSAVVVGGAKPGPQIRAMARGVDILVATPGRLEDHMQAGAIRLDETTTVVLDEADQMLDLGFMPAIRRILAALPKDRQTALLSATMPKQIRALAQEFLRNPVEVAVAPQSKPIDRIEQTLIHVEKANKRQMLVDVMKREKIDRAVVFTRTKHGANKLAQLLVNNGLKADAIHGNKSQNQRVRTLDDFKAGRTPILVATDIAARGIDVEGVSHVVNFDLPNVSEVFVHRIGRTARAGKSGIAISICDETEREFLRDIEKLIGFKLKLDPLSETDLVPEQAPEKPGSRNGRGNGRGRTRRAEGNGSKKPGTRKPRPNRAKKAKRPQQEAAQNADGQNTTAQNTSRTARPANRQTAKPKARKHRKGGNKPSVGADDAGLSRMLGNITRSQKPSQRSARQTAGQR